MFLLLLFVAHGIAGHGILRYIFPVWDMNTYDSGIVMAKGNATVLEDRLNFYSLMQKINLGHTLISSVGSLGMATVAFVVAPIPGTIGATAFGLYAGYHGLLKFLSSIEVTQAQFGLKEIREGIALRGDFVSEIRFLIPEFFYSSDLLGFCFVAIIVWGAWKVRIHEIRTWGDMWRVFGLLLIIIGVLICIGFVQTIRIVQEQDVARRAFLEREINHRCNILKMRFMQRLKYEALSLMGAVVDEDGFVHNAACDSLVAEYRLIRGDLLTIAGKCLSRAFYGAVVEELVEKTSWSTRILLLAVLAMLIVVVLFKSVVGQPGDRVLGPSIRIATIGIIVLVFLKLMSIV